MNNIVVGYTEYKKNPYIHTGIKIQMNKWLNDTDTFLHTK